MTSRQAGRRIAAGARRRRSQSVQNRTRKNEPLAAKDLRRLLQLVVCGGIFVVLVAAKLLLPATTALGTIDPKGREKGILAGANVVMPNLSPTSVRKKYELYDNKICTGDEAAECRACLNRRMEQIGYELVTDRGDYKEENYV